MNPQPQPGGPWMQTYTGRAFPVLEPKPDDIDPLDIAHALSLTCRYGGHSRWFYSVAEHCVMMSYAVLRENALWALLHDAAEAYVGDVVSPLKRSLPDFVQAENRVMQAVKARFGLPGTLPDEVAQADLRILLTERAAVLGPTPHPWDARIEALQPLPVPISCWEPREAKKRYLDRLHQLTEEDAR